MVDRTILWEGVSGKKYKYWIYDFGYDNFDPATANYIFAKESPPQTHNPIYIGETEDISDRFDSHHKMDCIKRNGNLFAMDSNFYLCFFDGRWLIRIIPIIPIEFSHNVKGVNIRKEPRVKDKAPSQITLEGAEPQIEAWPKVAKSIPASERVIYPGAGSELFHSKKML